MIATLPAAPAAVTQAQKRKRRIPSERNRRVYEQVVLFERPQEEVAKEFKVTQQRVSQIVEHFQAWLAENLPAGAEHYSPEEQLRLAASTAYLRQEHLYGQAMQKLDLSCQDKQSEKIRYSVNGEVLWRERLRQNQTGKAAYLNSALTAAMNVWKLAQMAQGLLGRAMEIEFWLPRETSQGQERLGDAEWKGSVGPTPGTDAKRWSASAGPPETAAAEKVLWNSSPPSASSAAVAADALEATIEPAGTCAAPNRLNGAPPGPSDGCAKSCIAVGAGATKPAPKARDAERPSLSRHEERHSGEASRKVLWNSGQPGDDQELLAPGPAAASDLPSGTCGCSDDRKLPPPVLHEAPENSCEAAVTAILDAFRKRRHESPTSLSTDERRHAKKQRQKQLARWQARRKAG